MINQRVLIGKGILIDSSISIPPFFSESVKFPFETIAIDLKSLRSNWFFFNHVSVLFNWKFFVFMNSRILSEDDEFLFLMFKCNECL